MAAPSNLNAHEERNAALEEVSRSIGCLDSSLQDMVSGLQPKKPWQRQLLLHLGQARRSLHVLRMTIATQQSQDDVYEAARRVNQALSVAQSSASTSRADTGTKAAISLAQLMGTKISEALISCNARAPGTLVMPNFRAKP